MFAGLARAAVQVPGWFGDGMVLQAGDERGQRAALSGRAGAHERVSISGGAGTYSTVADAAGVWLVELAPQAANVIVNITLQGEDGPAITAHDVIFGDVYFCGGQSNMVFPLKLTMNATAEIETIEDPMFENFRFFTTPSVYAAEPQWNFSKGAKWVTARAAKSYVKGFSAVCYMTVRNIALLHTKSRAMGLIQSAWSGTRIEAWASAEALNASGFAGVIPEQGYKNANNKSALYNGMVAPWEPFVLRGAIWYQGEANGNEVSSGKLPGVDATAYYKAMLTSMVADWRARKGEHFDWLEMQLAPSVAAGTPVEAQLATGWMEIRLAQQEFVDIVDTGSSGIAVGMDLGGSSAWGIGHPPNKNEMARRLALQAVHVFYNVSARLPELVTGAGGEDGLTTWAGPHFSKLQAGKDGSGLLVEFDEGSTVGGLRLRDVKALNIDGSSNDCTRCCDGAPPFDVTFDGQNWTTVSRNNTVIDGSSVRLMVNAAEVQGVRYAWLNYVECVLENGDQLPATPFVQSLPAVSNALFFA